MRVSVMFLIGFLLITCNANAQYDFEEWYDGYGWLELNNFGVRDATSSNEIMLFLGQSFDRSDNAYSGQYSAKLTSKKFNGTVYPASFAIGYHTPNYLELTYFNIDTLFVVTDAVLLHGNDVNIKCHYVFDEESEHEYGLLSYRIFAQDNSTIKASGELELPSKADWQKVELDFVYDYSQGDKIQVVLYGNHSSTENAMYIDDVSFSSEVVSSIENTNEDSSQIIYPNAVFAGQTNRIRFSHEVTQKEAIVFDLQGQLIARIDIENFEAYLPDLLPGVYLLQLGHRAERIIVK